MTLRLDPICSAMIERDMPVAAHAQAATFGLTNVTGSSTATLRAAWHRR